MMTTFSDPHSQELYFEAKRNPVRITDRCVALEIALKTSKAIADRRLELLKEGKDWIYRLLMDAGWVDIPHDDLVEYLCKTEKELDDTALGS